MKIRIEGFSIQNIRGFEYIDIVLNEKKITMIMMPNGTGKTTSIELIKYALNGLLKDKNVILTYRPSVVNANEGLFNLRLKIDDIKLVITMLFDFSEGKVEYKYTNTITGLESHKPFILDIFTQEFVEKFIFDGELAKEFLNSDSAYAEDSVVNIYHLEKLDDLSNKIDDIKSKLIQESDDTSASNESGYTRYTNELDSCEAKKSKLIKESNELKSKIEAIDFEITNIQNEIDNIYTSNISIQESIEKHTKKISNLTSELDNIIVNISNNALFVHNVSKKTWEKNRELIDVLVQMKLPKSVSEQFFIDIINHANMCICGRPLAECDKSYIQSNYNKYLEENNISILNEVKSYALGVNYSEEIFISLEEAIFKDREIRKEEKKMERAKQQINQEQKSKKEKLEYKKNEKVKLRAVMYDKYEKIVSEDDQIIKHIKEDDNIKKISVKIEKLKKIIEQVERNRKINYNASVIKNVIMDTKTSLLSKIKEDVLLKTNIIVKKIIQNDNIEIASIDRYIKIKNRDGVSVGQALSVSYSFISALFQNSFYDLPFVIDSPAGSLDNNYRHEISQIIPKVFDQLILFIISSEKPYFASTISELYSSDVKYYTIYKASEKLVLNDQKTVFDSFQDRS